MNEETQKQTIGEVKVTNKKSRERNKSIVLERENKLREDNIAQIRKEAYLQGAKDAIEAVKLEEWELDSDMGMLRIHQADGYNRCRDQVNRKAQQFIDSLEGKDGLY